MTELAAMTAPTARQYVIHMDLFKDEAQLAEVCGELETKLAARPVRRPYEVNPNTTMSWNGKHWNRVQHKYKIRALFIYLTSANEETTPCALCSESARKKIRRGFFAKCIVPDYTYISNGVSNCDNLEFGSQSNLEVAGPHHSFRACANCNFNGHPHRCTLNGFNTLEVERNTQKERKEARGEGENVTPRQHTGRPSRPSHSATQSQLRQSQEDFFIDSSDSSHGKAMNTMSNTSRAPQPQPQPSASDPPNARKMSFMSKASSSTLTATPGARLSRPQVHPSLNGTGPSFAPAPNSDPNLPKSFVDGEFAKYIERYRHMPEAQRLSERVLRSLEIVAIDAIDAADG